jgi:hypothetical protein
MPSLTQTQPTHTAHPLVVWGGGHCEGQGVWVCQPAIAFSVPMSVARESLPPPHPHPPPSACLCTTSLLIQWKACTCKATPVHCCRMVLCFVGCAPRQKRGVSGGAWLHCRILLRFNVCSCSLTPSPPTPPLRVHRFIMMKIFAFSAVVASGVEPIPSHPTPTQPPCICPPIPSLARSPHPPT